MYTLKLNCQKEWDDIIVNKIITKEVNCLRYYKKINL